MSVLALNPTAFCFVLNQPPLLSLQYNSYVLSMRTNYASYLDRRKYHFQVSIPIFSLLYPNIVFASFIYQDYQNSLKDANLSKTYTENFT